MKQLLYIAFALVVASCSTADHEDLVSSAQSTPETNSSHRITQDEAVNLAMSFRNGSETLSRSGDADESDVENVVVVRWEDLYPGVPNPVIGDDTPTSRASGTGWATIDTLFYVVNQKNNAGYTVVAADDRTDPIYAIVETGNYQLQGKYNPNVIVSNRAVNLLLNDINMDIVEKIDEVVANEAILIGFCIRPMLKTNWGTGSKSWELGNYHNVTIALAQAMSHYKLYPSGYSNSLDWDLVISDCKDNKGKPSLSDTKNQVKNLLTYINSDLEQKEWKDSIYGYDTQINEWLDNYNLDIPNFKPYKTNEVLDSLFEDKIVLMLGREIPFRGLQDAPSQNKPNTHVWLVDGSDVIGYTDKESGKFRYSKFMHCNWGKGGEGNGLYLGGLFSTTDSVSIDKGLNALGYGFKHEDVKFATLNPK